MRLRVTDEFGAWSEQDFTIRVVSAAVNRPPYFETPPFPVVETFVNNFPGVNAYNVSPWQAVDVTSNDPFADTTWQLLPGNTGARSMNVADASVFLSDTSLGASYIRGQITPGSSPTQGAFGLVFGYQDDHHFYLIEWTGLDTATIDPGIAIKRIDASSTLQFQRFDSHEWQPQWISHAI